MTAAWVTVGLKTAVIVRSGVGKTIGVGDETNGKLQASIAKATAPSARIGYRLIVFMLTSRRIIQLTCSHIIDDLAPSLMKSFVDNNLININGKNKELTLDQS